MRSGTRNSGTQSKLVLAAKSVMIAVPAMVVSTARGTINGPYQLDGNSVVLYHLDELAGATVAANTQGFTNSAIAWNQPAATAGAGSISTAILGQPGFAGFGNAATFGGSLVLGYDGNGSSTFEPDLAANTTNTNTSPDAIPSTLLTDPGGSGAFTLDALVDIPTAFAQNTNHEIISYDSSNGTAGQRGFQFRFSASNVANPVISLQYDNISDGLAAVSLPLPTTGPDAFALNTWFEVAMSYDGTGGPNSVRLYWTKVDPNNVQAHLLGTGRQLNLTAATNPNVLTFGNENRNTSGEPLNGYLDEVRISNRVRTSTEFIFGGLQANFWNNGGGGDWDNGGNWTISVPNASAATAYFGAGPNATTSDSIITVTGTKTLGAITIDSSTFKYTVVDGGSGTGALRFDNGVNQPTISIVSGGHEIAVPVQLTTSDLGIQTLGPTSTLTLSGAISGTSGLSKSGPGVLILSGTGSSYTGVTSIAGGTLQATDGVSLPATTNLNLSGGVFELTTNFARPGGTAGGQIQLSGGTSGFSAVGADVSAAVGTLASPSALNWSSATFAPTTLVLNGTTATNNLTFLNNINFSGAARTIEVDNNTATASGILSTSTAGGGLTKTGNGVLVLTNTNTYSGPTSINGGILRANLGTTLPNSGNISINGGILDSAVSITRNLGTAAAQIQIPGGNSGFNANGADIVVTINNAGAPIIWGSTSFAPGTLILNTNASAGNMTLVADFDLSGATRTIQVGGGTATYTGALSSSVTATAAALTVQGAATNVASTLVMTHPNNTYGGGTNISNNLQNTPFVLRVLASNALGTGVINNGSQGNSTTSQLQVANNIILPNAVDFWARSVGNNVPAFESLSGNNTFSGTLALGVGGANYFLQSDAGTLNVTGSDAAAAGVAVVGGNAAVGNPGGIRILTLQGAGNGVISGAIQNGTANVGLTKSGAGTWTLSGNNTNSGGTTIVNAGALIAPASIIPNSTSIAINGGELAVNYTGASPASAVRAMLVTGYNAGAWNGAGISSASAAADTTKLTAIGYGEAADLGITMAGGQPIGPTAVGIKYTYYGDASLDGKVDLGNDFNLFLQGFLTPGSSSWELGDFNYDGSVDMTDFGLFIDGIKAQGGSLGELDGVIAASSLLSSSQKASLLAVVPEPAMAGVIALAGVIGASRRRRKHGN
jgi:autotransporter-associated beta strand protein